MKTVLMIFITVFVFSGLAFATGKKEEPEMSAPLKAEASNNREDVLKVDSPTTINMIGWRFPITEFYAEELESMSDIDNLTVNTQLLDSAGVREQVRLALASGGESPYEIIHGDNNFLTELATQGKVLALDSYISRYNDQYDFGDISDTLYMLGSPDNKVYGIPFTGNTMHFFYNTVIFEEYNIIVPDTYDEVFTMIQQIEDSGADVDLPFAINLHAGWAWRIEFINFINGFGGYLLDDDGMPVFQNEPGVKALELILKIADAMGADGITWSIDDVEVGLETGRLASASTWASRAANMDDPTKSQFVGKIGFAPAPKVNSSGKRAAPAAADYYMIPKNTKIDPAYIFKVIAEATKLSVQELGADLSIMTRNTVAASRTDVRYLEAALTSISEGGAVASKHPGNSILIAILDNNLSKSLDNRGEIGNFLQQLADEYIEEARKQGVVN